MPSTDRRTRARELVMQALCQLDVQGATALDMLGIFFSENSDDPATCQLAEKWSKGAWDSIAECDKLISVAAVKWELARLNQVDRSILRLGAYQLKYCPDIPAKVVINEAIELAKKYSAESSPAFVNGVMDAIYKKLKTDLSAQGGGTDKCEK